MYILCDRTRNEEADIIQATKGYLVCSFGFLTGYGSQLYSSLGYGEGYYEIVVFSMDKVCRY